MKISLKIAVIALALAATVSTASAAFNTNLTVGSTGADVSALQTWLISKGFNIPSISSKAASTGYFGSQTKAAVVAYQKSVNIPSTGFVGPLTRAALNGTSATVVTPGTPVTPVTPGTPVVSASVNDGKDGSITFSSSSFVSSNQTLKKGDTDKGILSIKARATVGNVAVTRFDIHFNARPWLLFGSLTLKDAVTGAVLATKTLSGPADTTEVTVGSDYLVRFDGVNSVVTPNADTTYVVTANVLSASDKITGQTVTVTTDTNGFRTVNGLGYTDSVGINSSFNVTLSSTGSIADLYTRVGVNTPDTRTVNISTTNVTADQTLGVFDVKVQNQGGTINTISFNINNSRGFSAATLFQNVRLFDGNTFLGGASTLSATQATFTNLTIPLTLDTWKSLTLKADVIASSTAYSASSTIVASSVVGTDSGYNTITLTNAASRQSNDVTFVPNAGITVSNWVISKGNVTTPTSGTWLAAYPAVSFTITNTGNNPIYISKTAGIALATTTSSGPVASTTVSSVNASGSTSGDTATSYIINTNRTFTYNFTVDNTNGTTASKKISITQINYGTAGGAGTDNTLNVNYGLENAYVQVP
jgi:peptidoglycan hydrolase-like protein with peptidoglycan-binding domain